ncbi:hypothetical protein Slin15195_G043220 [Septoria linicola]|uniref:Uncharacterized protein n=1 Tax=Septoria linicola TaxID=215465 RepID=A0A9Q9EJ53_9PEZI|nr:hypothetical protein Slin15195_G043220 [Septoria linicola]
MRHVISEAATYRAQQGFVPLTAEIREHINRQCVSDEALEAIMKDEVDEKAAREHARRNRTKAFKPKKPRRTARETTPESRASTSPKSKAVGRRLAPRTAAPNTAHRPQPPPRRKGK